MAVTTFAAIDIGSYEVSMKIFEMSKRIGFREINDVRYQLELGRGTYAAGRLEMETVDELCEILNDFKRMMAEFGVESWRACATSSLREAGKSGDHPGADLSENWYPGRDPE